METITEMKEFEALNLQDPVLDEHGFIDLDFYQMKAERMRAEYLSDMFETLTNKIKNIVSSLTALVTGPKYLPPH